MRPSGRALGGGLLAAGLLAGAVTWAVARDDGAGTTAPITTSSTAAVAVVGQPGARGVGDPYFPELGNGGYDVDRYDLDLTWRPATGVLEGVATITATATQDLSSFDLDLSGMSVRSVRVDGTGVAFTRDAAELVITPAVAIAAGEGFTTTVAYDGAPKGIVGADAFSVGWQTFGPEVFVASEPEGAATFFPVNDHPSDKATYRFEVTAPSELTVATNGVALEHTTAGDGTTTWESEAREPMASYLVQVAIGEFAVVDGGASRSGVPIRHVVHRRHQAEATAALARTAEMIDVLEGVWGPYPFAVYGVLSVPIPLGFALETQTLTLIGQDTIADPRGLLTLVHELAHQWTGDAVSPATWKDIWLNEGFATYSEWLWTERTGGEPASAQARGIQALGLDTPPGDPGVAGLFGPAVYQRGALALQALREEVGDDVFFRTLRAWVDEHTGRSVSTMDLIALAERESGRELDALFDTWLYQQRLPRLDG